MRFNLLILALVAFIVSSASAQQFSPGYYITTSGDTIRKDLSLQLKNGFIDKIVTPEGLFLAPKDVNGFGRENINYVVRKVSIDKTPTGGFVTDSVFLEVMNRGKISLLYMIDENEKAHFYIENENGPQELAVRLNSQNNEVVVRKTESYKSALKGIFPTCTDLFPAIDKVVFSRKGIRSIYEKLYKCRFQEAAPAMVKEERLKSTEIGISGGVMVAKQSFHFLGSKAGADAAIVTLMIFPQKSVTPVFTCYLETKFGRRKTISFRHELSYIQYSQTSNAWKQNDYTTESYVATIGASYLTYSGSLRGYLFPNSSIRPFLSAGLSPMLALSKKDEMKKSSSGYGNPIFKDTNSATLTYFFGAGIAYQSFALEFRGMPFRGFTDEVEHRVKSYTFTLHYRIKQFGKTKG